MLNSERTQRLSEDEVGGGYRYTDPRTGKSYKFCGLLRLLRAECYADYSYDKAKRIAATPKAARVATGLTRPWHGRALGKIVHEQLRTLFNCGEKTLHAVHGNRVQSKVLNVAAALRHLKLRPVRAEFLVCYENAKLASAIDALAVRTDSHGNRTLSVLEVKSGGDNDFLNGNAPLRGAAAGTRHNNCPRSHAFLQLAFYRQMIADHYPNVRIGRCYVVQIRNEDTLFHELPGEFIATAPGVRDAVCRRRVDELARKQRTAAARRAATRKKK